jgi:regulator of protease activity HflC (stomatin/prohibitin superfamily)
MSDYARSPETDGPAPLPAPGPVLQSAAIGFRAVYIVTALLGVLWLCSNFRIISSDSQAVVMRFGRIVQTRQAGLLLAWPRPFEQVRMLPGPDRQLSHPVAALPALGGIEPASTEPGGDTTPASAAPYLTGDGAVVLLDATLIYRITDPAAYVLSQNHVIPALDRMFRATAVGVAAGWTLNDFVVAQDANANPNGAGSTVSAMRGAVRDQLLARMNGRLKALEAQGAGLGVEIDRIDMTALLPPEAKLAFDQVLTASQKADQDIAAASTAAERRRQGAQREADRSISAAQASAIEASTNANVDTANILAIEQTRGSREALAQQAYRDGVGQVLAKAGSVITVDPRSGARFIIPAPQNPGPPTPK